MNALTDKATEQVQAERVCFTPGKPPVRFNDGREISRRLAEVPWLKWLAKAAPKQRANWSLEPRGFVIYLADLDDGIEVCHRLNPQAIA